MPEPVAPTAESAPVLSSNPLTVLGGVCAASIAFGAAGFALTGHIAAAPAIRPASGVALAALVLFGLRAWPGVFAGALVLAGIATRSAPISVVTAAGETLGALAGAALIARFATGRNVFRSVRTTLRGIIFICGAAVVPAMIVVSINQRYGFGPLTFSGCIGEWLGYGTGALILAPCVLTGLPKGIAGLARARWSVVVEGAAMLSLLAMAALAVFAGLIPWEIKTYPLEFVCLPFLLWAAFRFGPREVTVSVAMLSSIAVWGTLRRLGPFASNAPTDSVWLLQVYVMVMSITGVALASIVDERQRAEAQLHAQATTDPLTGLVNYRRLLEVLRIEMARSRRTGRSFVVLLVDMDGLKQINDRFGHLAGSRAICRVADVLRRSTRETDVVSRFGGDEFAVVLPESGDAGGHAVIARVAEQLAVASAQPRLSISGGHAVFPRDGDSPTLLLRAADQRLYAAKHRGGTTEVMQDLAAVGA